MERDCTITAMGKSLVIVLAMALPISAVAKHAPALKRYASKECGISFSYPAKWKVTAGRERCSVVLVSTTKHRDPELDLDPITVTSGTGSFDEAADGAGFYKPRKGDEVLTLTEKEHIGEWMFNAGEVPAVAEPLKVGEFSGLEAWASSRCYHPGGGYAGQCDYFAAFVAHDGRWIAAQGHDEDFILKLLGTAVFDARQ